MRSLLNVMVQIVRKIGREPILLKAKGLRVHGAMAKQEEQTMFPLGETVQMILHRMILEETEIWVMLLIEIETAIVKIIALVTTDGNSTTMTVIVIGGHHDQGMTVGFPNEIGNADETAMVTVSIVIDAGLIHGHLQENEMATKGDGRDGKVVYGGLGSGQ